MAQYRRVWVEGGCYCFTVVTYGRREILDSDMARWALRFAFDKIREKRPIEVIAMCVLPDHLHCIWELPKGDCDYSVRWSLIKKFFTKAYLEAGGKEVMQSKSRMGKRYRGIWQKRFWEHCIRDERDLQNHINYIHYNPVKHGVVDKLEDWRWSTYHKYLRDGHYGDVGLAEVNSDFSESFLGEG